MSLLVRVRFEKVARALRDRVADAHETLTYRRFATGAGDHVVIEEYAGAAAALAHNARSAEPLARAAERAELVSGESYGYVGPELDACLAANPQVITVPEVFDPRWGRLGRPGPAGMPAGEPAWPGRTVSISRTWPPRSGAVGYTGNPALGPAGVR